MFNISGPELLLCALVAVLAIGPRELPQVMRALGRVVRRLQYIRYAFSQQFEDFMKEHDLDELRRAGDPTVAHDEKDADAGVIRLERAQKKAGDPS